LELEYGWDELVVGVDVLDFYVGDIFELGDAFSDGFYGGHIHHLGGEVVVAV